MSLCIRITSSKRGTSTVLLLIVKIENTFLATMYFLLYLMKDEISSLEADKRVLVYCFEFQAYLKSHFSYNPNTDNLIPCKEAGLAFSKGDILQVVNKEDSNWWQVSRFLFPLLSM